MKLILLYLFALVVIVTARTNETYTDRFDNLDIDEILHSERLIKNYMDCLLDKGRCTPDGKTLKELLPDALENDCSKCTAVQKKNADKVLRFFVNKRKDLWRKLKDKYDPNSLYADKFRDRLKKLNIDEKSLD